jgi:hypothetical protein
MDKQEIIERIKDLKEQLHKTYKIQKKIQQEEKIQ